MADENKNTEDTEKEIDVNLDDFANSYYAENPKVIDTSKTKEEGLFKTKSDNSKNETIKRNSDNNSKAQDINNEINLNLDHSNIIKKPFSNRPLENRIKQSQNISDSSESIDRTKIKIKDSFDKNSEEETVSQDENRRKEIIGSLTDKENLDLKDPLDSPLVKNQTPQQSKDNNEEELKRLVKDLLNNPKYSHETPQNATDELKRLIYGEGLSLRELFNNPEYENLIKRALNLPQNINDSIDKNGTAQNNDKKVSDSDIKKSTDNNSDPFSKIDSPVKTPTHFDENDFIDDDYDDYDNIRSTSNEKIDQHDPKNEQQHSNSSPKQKKAEPKEEQEDNEESPKDAVVDKAKETTKKAVKSLLLRIFIYPPTCFITWTIIFFLSFATVFIISGSIITNCIVNFDIQSTQCSSLTSAITDDVKKSVLSSVGVAAKELEQKIAKMTNTKTETPTDEAKGNSGVTNPSD